MLASALASLMARAARVARVRCSLTLQRSVSQTSKHASISSTSASGPLIFRFLHAAGLFVEGTMGKKIILSFLYEPSL